MALGGWISGRGLRVGLLGLLVAGYLAAAGYNLGLPGLHYDEAKEAGLNALELLRGHTVTAFRGATVEIGPWSLPLMVQDYIGALNVYWVMPFLALSGIGVPNLRWPAILIGVATLLLLERLVSEWWQWQGQTQDRAESSPSSPSSPSLRSARAPLSWAGLLSVAVLALSPSFVFWSRQGIFVTNLTQPLTLLALWQGVRWLRTGRASAFVLTGGAAGLALYAKLLAAWVLLPFALTAFIAYLRMASNSRRTGSRATAPRLTAPRLTVRLLAAGLAAFLLMLTPFFWFNVQTGGTLAQLGGNLGESYYGVDNLAWRANLGVRLGQVVETLRGDQFWYLGGLYANGAAPWLALVGVAAVVRAPRLVGLPLVILGGALALSIFTLSDLFITHFALLQPVMAGVIAIGWAAWFPRAKAGSAAGPPAHAANYPVRASLVVCVALLWLALDGWATFRYHGALAQSGGLGDHADATYDLAYHLRYNGLGAPIALDWGIDAPVRYLSENTVQPIEIFGYASPAAPDPEFRARLALFLDNPDNVYLLRSAGQTVFEGRRAIFVEEAAARDLKPVLLATFSQRDETPLFELWQAQP